MPVFHISGPATEVVTVTDLKNFLKVETVEDDALIAQLITAARQKVEAESHRRIGDQTWRVVADHWIQVVELPIRLNPVRQITAARVRLADGNFTSVDVGRFSFRPGRYPNRMLINVAGIPMPEVACDGVEIDLLVGYGTAQVPAALMQAIRQLAGHWYDMRDFGTERSSYPLPAAIKFLCAPWRLPRI